jgi:hypothetical protein
LSTYGATFYLISLTLAEPRHNIARPTCNKGVDHPNNPLIKRLSARESVGKGDSLATSKTTLCNLTTKSAIKTISARTERSTNSDLNNTISLASGVSNSHGITTTGNRNILKASHNILLNLCSVSRLARTLRPNLTLAATVVNSYAIKAGHSSIIKRLHIAAGNALERLGIKLVALCPLTGQLTIDEHYFITLG